MSSQILTTFLVHETRRSLSLRVHDIVGELRQENRPLVWPELPIVKKNIKWQLRTWRKAKKI